MTSTIETMTRAKVEELMANVKYSTFVFRDSANSNSLTLATRDPLNTGDISYQVIPGTGGGNTELTTVSKSLTAAQIKTLNSVPVAVGLTPIVGSAFQVIAGSVKYTYNGVAFSSEFLNIKTDTASGLQAQASILDATSSRHETLSLSSYAGTQLITNKDLYITSDADSVAGDGTAVVYITYMTVTP